MADADDGENLAVGLEVLPGRGGSAAEDELEAEAPGVPGLISEGRLLVLRVEGAYGGERDRLVAEQHRQVVPHQARRDLADREHGHSDHGARLDADVGLHDWGRSDGGDLRVLAVRQEYDLESQIAAMEIQIEIEQYE